MQRSSSSGGSGGGAKVPKTLAVACCAGCAAKGFYGADGVTLRPCPTCNKVFYCSEVRVCGGGGPCVWGGPPWDEMTGCMLVKREHVWGGYRGGAVGMRCIANLQYTHITPRTLCLTLPSPDRERACLHPHPHQNLFFPLILPSPPPTPTQVCARLDYVSHKNICKYSSTGMWQTYGGRPVDDYWVNNAGG